METQLVCLQLAHLSLSLVSPLFFFFFQAEDGIRDYKVTGVQTCALPIFEAGNAWATRSGARLDNLIYSGTVGAGVDTFRSEERRVGKECRSRWSPYH